MSIPRSAFRSLRCFVRIDSIALVAVAARLLSLASASGPTIFKRPNISQHGGVTFGMGKCGLVTFCNSKRWTKEVAEGVQFTVENGY